MKDIDQELFDLYNVESWNVYHPDEMTRKIMYNFRVGGIIVEILNEALQKAENSEDKNVELIYACTKFLQIYIPNGPDQESFMTDSDLLRIALKYQMKSIELLISCFNSPELCARFLNHSLIIQVVECLRDIWEFNEEEMKKMTYHQKQDRKKFQIQFVTFLIRATQPEEGVPIRKNQTAVIKHMVQVGLISNFSNSLATLFESTKNPSNLKINLDEYEFSVGILSKLISSCCVNSNSTAISFCQQNISYKKLLEVSCNENTKLSVHGATLELFHQAWLEPIFSVREMGTNFGERQSTRNTIYSEINKIIISSYGFIANKLALNKQESSYVLKQLIPVINILCARCEISTRHDEKRYNILQFTMDFLLKITGKMEGIESKQGSLETIQKIFAVIRKWSSDFSTKTEFEGSDTLENEQEEAIHKLKMLVELEILQKTKLPPPQKTNENAILIQEHFNTFSQDFLYPKFKKEEFVTFLSVFCEITNVVKLHDSCDMLVHLISERLDDLGTVGVGDEENEVIVTNVSILCGIVEIVLKQEDTIRLTEKKVNLENKLRENRELVRKVQNSLHEKGATKLAV
ncbi:hypothetical protein HK096_010580, partial [Nowakowskiella sp. JEL0078]